VTMNTEILPLLLCSERGVPVYKARVEFIREIVAVIVDTEFGI
jgi:hypothetical protein